MLEALNQTSNFNLVAMGMGTILLFIILMAWSLAWKGIALWKAARNGSKIWYVVLLVVNTAGILEIIYIFAIAKGTEMTKTTPQTPSTQA